MGKNSRTSSHANGTTTTNSNGSDDASGLLHAVQTRRGRELVDQLREIGLDHYVELPQIAVMGDTSSGKSSLLSALSGVAFPSSHELTTRCPTQLILSQHPTFRGNVRLHRFESNKIEHEDTIATMDDVPVQIEKLTKLLVSEGQIISDDSIVIELCGPKLPNLTLTDLPGLVRTVSDGEDEGIIERIRTMVHRYMKQSRTIIIAVVPANVDMHNTEILQAAQEADPEGVRTIAVVTKIDLVAGNTEKSVRELLMNQKKHMKLGYHAVKCRSQKDLDENVTIEQAKRNEKAFFTSHQYWSDKLPAKLWGIDKLTARLVDILQDNIRRTLPSVKKEICDQMDATRKELEGLGSSFDSPSERRRVFSDWVGRFLRPLQAVLKGDYETTATTTSEDQDDKVDLRLRAQIRRCDEIFYDQINATSSKMPGRRPAKSTDGNEELQPGDYVVVKSQDGSGGADKSFRVQEINDKGDVLCPSYAAAEWLGRSRYVPHTLNYLRRFIVQNRGDELPIFPPYGVFCSILGQWVETWEPPSMELVEQYEKTTLRVATRLARDLKAVPRVEAFIIDRAEETLQSLRAKAEDALRVQITMEKRPYTQDPKLTTLFTQMLRPGLETLLAQRLAIREDGTVPFSELLTVLTDLSRANDEHDTVVMDCALRAYFQSAITRFVDLVPMRLDNLVLQGFVDRMQELQYTVDDKLERLLDESEDVRMQRAELAQKLQTLRDAKKQIEDM